MSKKIEREKAMESCPRQGRRGWGGCQIQGVSDILSLERGRKKERK